MPITDEIREMIIDRRSHEDLRKLSQAQGMRTLQEESLRLVQDGITSLGEVIRTIYVGGI